MTARTRLQTACILLGLGLLPTAAAGDDAGSTKLSVVGSQFQVNTYTTDPQGDPVIALEPDGDFVVVWESGQGSSFSVQGQRFASDGSLVGGEFQANTYNMYFQQNAAVAVEPDGDFVVVWSSLGSAGTDTSNFSVQGQRFASDGSAVGGEFQVNTYTTGVQTYPSVAVDADGDFLVVWSGNAPAGTALHGQLYASNGSTVGGEFQVSSEVPLNQNLNALAVDASGNFVVVWENFLSAGTDTSGRSIQARRIAADGSFLGADFQVNTYTTDSQDHPGLAVEPDGDFVVTWNSEGSAGTDSDRNSIQAQRYASDGSAVGGEFQVNTYTTSYQFFPKVAVEPDGDFVVVWASEGSAGTDTSGRSIQGQLYASDGSAVGGQFQVNTYTTNLQNSTTVALGAGGNFVVAWESAGSPGDDSSSLSIQAQLFAPDADLGITKDDGVTAAIPGGSVVYTIVASNAGPGPASPVSVTDTFPAALACSWTSVAAGGATGNTSSSGNLAESLTMPASSSVTYTVTCAIDPAATGTLSNTATISSPLNDPSTGDNSATDSDTILVPTADLGITKDDGVTSATPGGSVIYSIVASNAGPSAATSVSVSDTFPADLTCSWTSGASGGATGNSSSSGDLADNLTMPVSSSVTYTVSCTIDAAATGTLSNTATISSPAPDPVPGNDSATDDDTVLVPMADLSLFKLGEPDPVVQGDLLTYTLTVDNAGPSDSSGGTVTDDLPAGLDFEFSADCTAAGQTVTCPVPAIPAMDSVSLSFEARVNTASAIFNTATLVGNETDPEPGNDAGTSVTEVEALAVVIPTLGTIGLSTLLVLLALAGLHLVRRQG